MLDFCFLEVEDLYTKFGYMNHNRRTYDMFFRAGIDKDSNFGPYHFIKLYRDELVSMKRKRRAVSSYFIKLRTRSGPDRFLVKLLKKCFKDE